MNSKKTLFLIILLVGCLGQFGSDIYAPALPAIAKDFATKLDLVQISMAIYMLGGGLSILVYGPLSEGLGRKQPLLIGLSINLLGSLLCLLATNIDMLIAGRLLQGLGIGATAALWRAIFRDTFSGEDLSKYGSYFALIVMFVIPVAPTLGGYLQHYIHWQAIFAFLMVYAVVTLLAVIFCFQETSQHHHPERLRVSFVKATYGRLLTDRVFMGASLACFFSYGAFFSWFVSAPILLIHVIKITPVEFGWLNFIGGGAAYALASVFNGRMVKHLGMAKMLRIGWSIMILSGAAMLASYYYIGVSLFAILIPALTMYFGASLIWPNCFGIAFTPFGDIAGFAGAMYGFMQMAGGAIIGMLTAHLPEHNQVALALMFIVAPALSWIIYEKMRET